MNDNDIKNELESIKKLLIFQLIKDGAPHAAVAKAAGMSTNFVQIHSKKYFKNKQRRGGKQ